MIIRNEYWNFRFRNCSMRTVHGSVSKEGTNLPVELVSACIKPQGIKKKQTKHSIVTEISKWTFFPRMAQHQSQHRKPRIQIVDVRFLDDFEHMSECQNRNRRKSQVVEQIVCTFFRSRRCERRFGLNEMTPPSWSRSNYIIVRTFGLGWVCTWDMSEPM